MIVGERVDSIGTCSNCGYHGPGPQHDCKAPPVPAWLDQVLAKHAVLDLHHPDARRELAAAITAAAGANSPQAAVTITETITCSAKAVLDQAISSTRLQQNVLVDAEYAPRIAREIGRNAAQTVLLVLAVGED